jgi:hypothetical protein
MQNQLGDCDQERNSKGPYGCFYHFRHDLRKHLTSQLSAADRQELEVLLAYINETQGEKFDKVDTMFKSGTVHREIFSKLFRPNDLIVTTQDVRPRAYIAERAYVSDRCSPLERQTISLECWTWDFDGSLRKQATPLQVAWQPNSPNTVRVRSFSAWPLRLGDSKLRDHLEKRGKQLWSCRHKKMITYNALTPSMSEMQVVSISSFS